jgi:hypothetical protein
VRGRYLDLARKAREEEPATLYPCLTRGQAADERTLYCAGCWEKRLARMPLDVVERWRRLDRARLPTSPQAARPATGPGRP